ncbi:glycosyltransferase [Empedobacter sp. 189-2]|uniref:glycosyltransferase n=1 Tax=Empedobacter sp. 189-2 TaxID=2746724 RepID=UPI0025788EAE|nr:glycosyltransferase [Empedobacter sp. 189-2]MDM1541801.1 glycosyltransferase family 4 protein [Empedobacter sp. 189-2]
MKNLVFVTEARFVKDNKGNIFGDASFSNSLWERYLSVFDKVYVMARVNPDSDFIPKNDSIPINNSKVIFIDLPYYIGPLGYFKNYFRLKKTIINSIKTLKNCSYICRLPGQLGTMTVNILLKNNLKYALEIVGDPDDVFSPGTIQHPLRAYFRKSMIKSMKYSIINAQAVLYVTKHTLQNKYPFPKNIFTTYASNVQLNKLNNNLELKKWKPKNKFNIISVGSLEQLYKSPDIVLEAIKILNKSDLEFKLTWVGDGHFKKEMIQLAEKLNISNYVNFIGNVDKTIVYEELNKADIFVLASRTEGLPRAIIEAMSIGLPVIGTRVGGIPELIEDSVLIDKNDANQLADRINQLIKNEDFYNNQVKRNFDESKEYNEKSLMKRRLEFYNYIKNDF